MTDPAEVSHAPDSTVAHSSHRRRGAGLLARARRAIKSWLRGPGDDEGLDWQWSKQ